MGSFASKFLLFLIMSASVHGQQPESEGQDILLKDPYLSVLYQRGKFLIYNCLDQHWVCAGEGEFAACLLEREESIADNQRALPCAPVQEFSSEQACNKYQRDLTDFNMENRFCLHPEQGKQELNY